MNPAKRQKVGPGCVKKGSSIYRSLINVARKGNYELAQELIEAGANVNASNSPGETPLIVAAMHRDMQLIRLFLQHGANVNACNRAGRTALMYAAQNGDVDIAQVLLENGTDVSRKTVRGDSVLIMAAHNGYYRMVKFLLDNGANANVTNNAGMTALMYAVKKQHTPLVRLLLPVSDLMITCKKGGSVLSMSSGIVKSVVMEHMKTYIPKWLIVLFIRCLQRRVVNRDMLCQVIAERHVMVMRLMCNMARMSDSNIRMILGYV